MIDLLKNTLGILGKMSGSSSGYVFKHNSGNVETISYFSREENENGSLRSFFLEVANLGEHGSEQINDLSSFKKLSPKNKWKSGFSKKIWTDDKNLDSYYLILLSNKINNYSKAGEKNLMPVIDTLSEEVKTQFSLQNQNQVELIAVNNLDKNNNLLENYSTELSKGFMECSEDLVFILDKFGCFFIINKYGAAILDYDVEELPGTHLIELVSTKNKSGFSREMHKILEEEKMHSFETSLISKFGNEIAFSLSCRVLKEDQKIIGILGVAKNITDIKIYEGKINDLNNKLIENERVISIERQRSQRQKSILYELNRMKNEFISNISHELRTPLASIIGFSETIVSDPNMPDEMRREFNEIILNEGKRLAKLINDVLDLSKIESGLIELNKTKFDIIEILNQAIDSYRDKIEEKGLTLTVEVPVEKVMLKADKEKMIKVFGSLISNALKFTKKGGRIRITAQALYKEFEVIISDTGIGINEKDLPFIFQKFYKTAPDTETPGTGLGLVFVKQIVDLHKGFISIKSELNKGTSVVLKFPREFKV